MADNVEKRPYLTIESLQKRAQIVKPIASIKSPVIHFDKFKMHSRFIKPNKSGKDYVNKNKKKEVIVKPVNVVPSVLSLDSYRSGFIYDQGPLGSCTANAFCLAKKMQNKIANKNVNFLPSRLFFYYQERVIIDTVNEDSGANVIDGLMYTQSNGICSEALWPYVISKFTVKPPPECDVEALKYKISNYSVIPIDKNLLTNIKNAIISKKPVLIAVAVYSSFETITVAKTGMVPVPNVGRERLLGGHEMCLIGYDDTKKLFTVANSWGSGWGVRGLCYIPYTYLSNPNLAFEFTIFSV